MHLLVTRVIGVTFLPAVIYLATLVTASGAPAIHLRVGHSVFLPGFYLPLQVFFFFQAFKTGEWKYVFASAMTLALMVFNGGTHILPMSIAALGTFSLCAAIARRDWRPLAFAALFGAAGLAYSAPKLLPVVQYVSGEQFWDTRNPTEKPDRVTLDMLKQTYLVPTQDVGARLPMQRHGWHEYGNYIGLGSAIAIALGLIWVFVPAVRERTVVWHLASPSRRSSCSCCRSENSARYAPAVLVAIPAAVFELQDPEPLHDPVPAVRRADARLGVSIDRRCATDFRSRPGRRWRSSCLGGIGASDLRQSVEPEERLHRDAVRYARFTG